MTILSKSQPRRKPPPRVAAGAATLVALSVLLGACRSADSLAHAPPVPAVVDVTMSEYRFDYDRLVPAGRVVFRVRNIGREQHSLDLLPLTDDVPPIDQQLHGSERRFLVPFAGAANREAGETGTFAVDLLPGQRYALICYTRDADGQPHALKGMNSEFRAAGTSP